MKSLRQISEMYNINHATVAKRAYDLECNPIKKIWRSNYYSELDVKNIVNHTALPVNNKKKILIIEYYLMYNYLTYETMAVNLGVNVDIVRRVINDYKKEDCLIIKSKL